MATMDLTSIVNKTKGNIDIVIRKTVLEIFSALVKKSPVDSGRFRGNWQLGVGNAPSGVLERSNKQPKGSAPSGDLLGSAVSAVPEKASGMVYYLVNNLPYAKALEDGHSGQAPQGMVSLTAMEFTTHLNKSAAGVK